MYIWQLIEFFFLLFVYIHYIVTLYARKDYPLIDRQMYFTREKNQFVSHLCVNSIVYPGNQMIIRKLKRLVYYVKK